MSGGFHTDIRPSKWEAKLQVESLSGDRQILRGISTLGDGERWLIHAPNGKHSETMHIQAEQIAKLKEEATDYGFRWKEGTADSRGRVVINVPTSPWVWTALMVAAAVLAKVVDLMGLIPIPGL